MFTPATITADTLTTMNGDTFTTGQRVHFKALDGHTYFGTIEEFATDENGIAYAAVKGAPRRAYWNALRLARIQ